MNDKDYYIKTDFDGYLRDKRTNIIINTNDDEYLSYKDKINQFKKLNTLEKEVNQIKSDVTDIKFMLNAILGKLNG